MHEFLMPATTEIYEFMRAIADEMVKFFGIPFPEAVARVNAQWQGDEFLDEDEIILHEDEYYWAMFIYFDGDVPDWRKDADRSRWRIRPAPPRDSVCWTMAQ